MHHKRQQVTRHAYKLVAPGTNESSPEQSIVPGALGLISRSSGVSGPDVDKQYNATDGYLGSRLEVQYQSCCPRHNHP